MKKIEVVLKGTSPLLMHSAHNLGVKDIKKSVKTYDSSEQAEAVAYRNSKGELYIPARCLKASILNAASWYKFGKVSAKQLLAGCTRINPQEIVLIDSRGKPLKDYVIDLRPVNVQRNKIIRARPRLDDWQIKFQIVYNEKQIDNIEQIRLIIEEAGQRIGLLDNRPQKYGENGTYELVSFKPTK